MQCSCIFWSERQNEHGNRYKLHFNEKVPQECEEAQEMLWRACTRMLVDTGSAQHVCTLSTEIRLWAFMCTDWMQIEPSDQCLWQHPKGSAFNDILTFWWGHLLETHTAEAEVKSVCNPNFLSQAFKGSFAWFTSCYVKYLTKYLAHFSILSTILWFSCRSDTTKDPDGLRGINKIV